MATSPPRGASDRSNSPTLSDQTKIDKGIMASQSEAPALQKAASPPPPRTETMRLEGPFKFSLGKMVSLSEADHAFVCHAIGASSRDEANSLLHPNSTVYPSRGLPSGLYRDVIHSRATCAYQYYFCLVWINVSLFLQLVLGASMTALASSSNGDSTAITVLAAANTVNAGLLALMHNSGLPDRYKNDWTEYEKVELFMKELIASGIIREEVSREDVIIDCYKRYAKAKQTVLGNKPSAYTPSASKSEEPSPKK